MRSRGTSMRVAATQACPHVPATTARRARGHPLHRVGQVDLRRLAAELERDALHRRRRLRQDRRPDRGRSGERDHVDRRVRASSARPRRPRPRSTTLSTPGRQPRRIGRRAEHQRRDRRQRARPQHHRVAGHQRRDQLLERHEERGVVGGDRRDDADRLVAADAQRDPPPGQLVDRAPGWAPRAPSTGRGRSRCARSVIAAPNCAISANHDRLPRLRHTRRHDRRAPGLELIEEREQHPRPILGRPVGPDARVEALAGLYDRLLELRRGRRSKLRRRSSRRPDSRPRSCARPGSPNVPPGMSFAPR